MITCQSPTDDAPTPGASTPPASGPTTTVDQSQPGKSIITIGQTSRVTAFPAQPGSSSTTATSSTASNDPIVAEGASAVFVGPKYQPAVKTTHVVKRPVLASSAQPNNSAALAPLVFGSGLIVLAFVLMIAGVVRRRKVRRMRRS